MLCARGMATSKTLGRVFFLMSVEIPGKAAPANQHLYLVLLLG